MSQSVASRLKASDRLLERFLEVLSDTHDLADRTHLGAELIFHALELFKCPAGEFYDHIVAIRNILIQCAVFSARDIRKCQPAGKHCGNQRDWESRRLGCKC